MTKRSGVTVTISHGDQSVTGAPSARMYFGMCAWSGVMLRDISRFRNLLRLLSDGRPAKVHQARYLASQLGVTLVVE